MQMQILRHEITLYTARLHKSITTLSMQLKFCMMVYQMCVLSIVLALYHPSEVPPTFLGNFWIYGIKYTCK